MCFVVYVASSSPPQFAENGTIQMTNSSNSSSFTRIHFPTLLLWWVFYVLSKSCYTYHPVRKCKRVEIFLPKLCSLTRVTGLFQIKVGLAYVNWPIDRQTETPKLVGCIAMCRHLPFSAGATFWQNVPLKPSGHLQRSQRFGSW